ncbi:hypothetical protein RND71_040726 [Anisodus tanguticus]|uniref:Uncharacterized protein n=1 Tax=Anisodus tanguticus TaxID=243964 RepID=A0AAE1UW14_9SOLA|nr:hypothetical protein RND71_040726 [Anisodus tanguticus]
MVLDGESTGRLVHGKRRCSSSRTDGTSFWLHISPVRNASRKVAYFVGVEGEDNSETMEKPGLRQHGVVAAVKIVVRGLSMGLSPQEPHVRVPPHTAQVAKALSFALRYSQVLVSIAVSIEKIKAKRSFKDLTLTEKNQHRTIEGS